MSEFVGSYISKEVNDQLIARSKVQGKSVKSIEDLQYLNSKTGWVRVISSVNTGAMQVTLTSPTVPGLTVSGPFDEGTPELSKKYILSGPVSYTGNDTFSQKQDIDFVGNSNKLYNYNSATGIRPAPGVTGFKVTSKNRFGTIREANVNFNVWSKEDIDVIEQLYFRPGYSAVVEWGHSLYIDNDGKLETSPTFNVGVDEYFSNINFSKIVDKTTENKKRHFGNYDAFIGYIKNFSWSLRPDGGYDCSVSVISFGEILESLTVRTPPAVIKASTVNSGPKDEIKSVVHLFFSEVSGINKPVVSIRDIEDTIAKSILQYEIGPFVSTRDYPIAFKSADFDTEKPFYIPLKILLTLLNSLMIKYDDCSKNESLVKFAIDENESGNYLTFNDHFSLDPKICILPKKPAPASIFSQCVLSNHPVFSDLANLFNNTLNTTLDENCLAILVSQRMVEETLDTYLKVDGDSYEFSVLEYIRDVLRQVNSVLGNINEIDVDYDEDLRKYKLIDRKRNVPETVEITLPDPLPLTGQSGIFSSLSVQSKISNKLGSMISIAAQGSSPGRDSKSLEDTSLWIAYNAGLVDRFAPQKTINGGECYTVTKEEEEAKTGWWEKIKSAFIAKFPYLYALGVVLSIPKQKEAATFTEIAVKAYIPLRPRKEAILSPDGTRIIGYRDIPRAGTYDPTLFDKVKTLGPPFFADLLNIQNINKDPNYVIKGIIPVELSFTTDGIGGLKIGQSFTISGDMLPSKFNNYGYIITGLDHSIENGKWTTQVKAQTYLLPQDSEASGGSTSVTSPTRTIAPTETDNPIRRTEFKADVNNLQDRTAKRKAEKYLGRTISESDWNLLVAATYAEASSADREYAWVMAVILNRVKSNRFPNKIEDVLNATEQFEAVTGNPNRPGPRSNYITGPPTVTSRNTLYTSITKYLGESSEENYRIKQSEALFFCADNEKLFRTPDGIRIPGRNPAVYDELKKNGITVGKSLFGTKLR